MESAEAVRKSSEVSLNYLTPTSVWECTVYQGEKGKKNFLASINIRSHEECSLDIF